MWLFSKFWHRYALLLFLYMTDSSNGESSKDVYTKECHGTSTGLSHKGTSPERYESYRERYSNCTLVTSNLEIVFLELTDDEYDLSFLEDIREVNGYVLIYGNHVSKIRLNKLRVIRGMTLFSFVRGDTPRFSLYVGRNSLKTNDTIGLQELQMPSLVEILRGDVHFSENRRLCFGENTINWDYIIGRERVRSINELKTDGFEKINCQSYGTCNESCAADDGKRYCWGSGSDMCQSIQTCKDCEDKRCTRQLANSCCSRHCIVGCNEANDNSQCLSCRKYARNNGESCVEECITPVFNVTSKSIETPEDKFIEGSKCVKRCANNLVLQDGRCSFNCRQHFVENRNSTFRECIPCVGEKCIVTCDGTNNGWLHKENIQRFLNCVKVKGNLVIIRFTFTGHLTGKKIDIEDLEQLSTIEEITGSLSVGASYDGFTSLSFLRNLRIIGADSPGDRSKGLYVTETSLTSLELNSLETVLDGRILIIDNPQLCFVKEINWSKIGKQTAIRGNKNSSLCAEEDVVCSSICSKEDGCMGPGNDSCVSCPHFQSIDRTCVTDCLTDGGFYVKEKGIRGNRECRPCHEECNGKCNGDGNTDCTECKNVKHLDACISACPQQMYPDADAVCQSCSSVCDQCTGNDTVLGEGGCSNCDKSIIRFEDERIGRCIMSETECDENYFIKDEAIRVLNDKSHPMAACRRCHPQCNGCTERKSSDCLECKLYRQNTTKDVPECVEKCSEGFYNGGTNHCLPCDPQCLKCLGPNVHECLLCKSVRVYRAGLTESYCDDVCPDGLYERKNEKNAENECVIPAASTEFMGPKTAIPVFVIIFIAIVGVVAIFVLLWRRQKMRQRRVDILDLEEVNGQNR